MDFFITLTSSPTKHQPDYETTWCEYRPQKPIILDGEYEVALVHQNMDMFPLKINANVGESVETIIKNANYKLMEWSSSQLVGNPKIIFNEDNLEFCLDVPDSWAYYVMDVDKNHI
ncbi:unnamed protein product [Brachionus calyciflorus]|uniref:Uncharacterized protein n=1 Tax=Brachionus calyciflorus TaxID=104777 RepID=A0A814N1F9_9BILA|nr:unnamed protein product [Brachionus calyciflorus]